MTAGDLANILSPECHEGVTRKGEFQPCDRPAVAKRYEAESDSWYPVCTRHTRGNCRPLLSPSDLALIIRTLRAEEFA